MKEYVFLILFVSYTNAIQLNSLLVTSTTSLKNPYELYYVKVSLNDVILSLPATSCNTATKFTIKRIDSVGRGHLYLVANTGDTIHGHRKVELLHGQSITVYSNSNDNIWYIDDNCFLIFTDEFQNPLIKHY